MRKIYLYIDDLRTVPTDKDRKVVCARTYKEAIKFIEMYKDNLDIIDFDHDLGGKKTGYDIAKYITKNNIKFNAFTIHSANPVGADNIRQELTNYLMV